MANLPYAPVWTDGPQGTVSVRNPKYGAYGDGVHDDTAAINAALTAGAGSTVYLPPGTYIVSSPVVIPAATALVGAGRAQSTILASSTGAWALPSPSGWPAIVGSVNSDDVTVANLAVDANLQVASGVAILGGDRPRLLDCQISNTAIHSGAHFFGEQAPGVNPVRYGTMRGNLVVNCVYGLVFDGTVQNSIMEANQAVSDGTSGSPMTSPISLDGTQGGPGGSNNCVLGNVCLGINNGPGPSMVVFTQADAVVSGNILAACAATGEAMAHLAVFTGSFSGNIFDNGSAQAAYGIWISEYVEVVGSGNYINNAATGLITDAGNATRRAVLRDTVMISCPTPINANSYGQYYDFGGAQLDHLAYRPSLAPAATPFVSGTAYQNTYALPVRIYQPVYATTAGTAGTVEVAVGNGGAPAALYTRQVSGASTNAQPDVIDVDVPAGFWYSFTATGATLANAVIIGR